MTVKAYVLIEAAERQNRLLRVSARYMGWYL